MSAKRQGSPVCCSVCYGAGLGVDGKVCPFAPYTKQAPPMADDAVPSNRHKWGRGEFMVIGAFRYSLGRMTYIVGDCVDFLIENWEEFNPITRRVIDRDLAREQERGCIGMDMDHWEWMRLPAHIDSRAFPTAGVDDKQVVR